MSGLPAESRAPQPGEANGGSDVPPAEVGDGKLEPAPAQPEEARKGPMAAARGAGLAEVARLLEAAEGEGPGSNPRPSNDRGWLHCRIFASVISLLSWELIPSISSAAIWKTTPLPRAE
ncbi:EP300-interacting inhibitor of differentiation 2-like [Choloepus didactylus]|uniref:EP300-interacting inhibitor of differentiation 2-like n=1 Tax=Choloepus didactylus TaxID=27675 RepID=UPI00189CCF83|nr:EP300-interacting inhibitor of differentiation 2-like [Choloepus didactylus]